MTFLQVAPVIEHAGKLVLQFRAGVRLGGAGDLRTGGRGLGGRGLDFGGVARRTGGGGLGLRLGQRDLQGLRLAGKLGGAGGLGLERGLGRVTLDPGLVPFGARVVARGLGLGLRGAAAFGDGGQFRKLRETIGQARVAGGEIGLERCDARARLGQQHAALAQAVLEFGRPDPGRCGPGRSAFRLQRGAPGGFGLERGALLGEPGLGGLLASPGRGERFAQRRAAPCLAARQRLEAAAAAELLEHDPRRAVLGRARLEPGQPPQPLGLLVAAQRHGQPLAGLELDAVVAPADSGARNSAASGVSKRVRVPCSSTTARGDSFGVQSWVRLSITAGVSATSTCSRSIDSSGNRVSAPIRSAATMSEKSW